MVTTISKIGRWINPGCDTVKMYECALARGTQIIVSDDHQTNFASQNEIFLAFYLFTRLKAESSHD